MRDKILIYSFTFTILMFLGTVMMIWIFTPLMSRDVLLLEQVISRPAAAIAAIFTFYLAWAQLGNIRSSLSQQRSSAVRQELNERDSFSIMLLTNERQRMYERRVKISPLYSDKRTIPNTDFEWAIRQIDPDKIKNSTESILLLQEALSFWEHLAASVNCGAANEYLIDKMHGGAARTAYKDAARYIRHRKRGKNSERIYDQFDRFIDNLLLNDMSEMKITQNTIDRCRERYLEEGALSKMKDLIGLSSPSYHHFSNLLAEKGLNQHEILVYEFADKTPIIKFEYVTDINKIIDELVTLYSNVKTATGFYPPSDDLKHWATTADANTHIIARDKQGKLVGHISVTNTARKEIIDVLNDLDKEKLERLGFTPDRYSSGAFPEKSFSEINKLARWHCDDINYSGLGEILYRTAIRYCNEVLKKKVAFTAIGQTDDFIVKSAIRLYFSEGAECVGKYTTKNDILLRVFVA